MSGGVRNLRAMFENKDTSTSPPADRGRSPGSSIGVTSNGASPRPLSKIRTSFVTVEKSGQVGLQLRRDTSGEPSLSRRRTSFSVESDEPAAIAQLKEPVAMELEARKNSSVISETIPEVAVETPSVEVEKKLEDVNKDTSKPLDTKPESKKATSDSITHTNGTAKPHPGKAVEKASSSKPTTRPAPISTAKVAVAPKKSPIKSPLVKTPTTPRGRGRLSEPRKEPEKKPEKTARASVATTKPANSTSTSARPAPKTRIQASPPQTGFVKPKPRSPTRPVKLPASLTAHTASSGSKTTTASPPTTGRQSLSRASGNVQHANTLQAHHALARSPSRVKTTASTSSHRPSAANNMGSRPSLGPPPNTLKKQPSRQSLPSTAPADDGFLARMMRPTTSSASKTLEKQSEVPKRAQSVRRPTTRDGPSRVHEPAKASSLAHRPKAAHASKPVSKEPKAAAVVPKKIGPKDDAKVASESAHTSKTTKLEASKSATESEIIEYSSKGADEVQNDTSEASKEASVDVMSESQGEKVENVVSTSNIEEHEAHEESILEEHAAEHEPAVEDRVTEDEPAAEPLAEKEESIVEDEPAAEDKELVVNEPEVIEETAEAGHDVSEVIETVEPVEEIAENSTKPSISIEEPVATKDVPAQPESAIEELIATKVEPAESKSAIEELIATKDEPVESKSAIEEPIAAKKEPTESTPVVKEPAIAQEEPEEEPEETAVEDTNVDDVEEEKELSTDLKVAPKELVEEKELDKAVASSHIPTKQPEAAEDPEDVKAREEIARLNAELMKASMDESENAA